MHSIWCRFECIASIHVVQKHNTCRCRFPRMGGRIAITEEGHAEQSIGLTAPEAWPNLHAPRAGVMGCARRDLQARAGGPQKLDAQHRDQSVDGPNMKRSSPSIRRIAVAADGVFGDHRTELLCSRLSAEAYVFQPSLTQPRLCGRQDHTKWANGPIGSLRDSLNLLNAALVSVQ